MATISGNVLGNLIGRLGNLSARTVNGRTVLAARPANYNASQEPQSVEVRQKFAVTASFAKFVLSVLTFAEIWKKVKDTGITVFNAIFKSNYQYSSVEKPTAQNILTPDGFPLQIETSAVDATKLTATIPALNAVAIFTPEEVNLSAGGLVVYHDPINSDDPDSQIISLSKEVSGYNFAQTYNLQMDFNILQQAIAAKYNKSILYLAVASKDAAGKIIQNSSTHSKASA